MRAIVWAGSAVAVLVIVIAALIGLRVTAPPPATVTTRPAAVAAPPAANPAPPPVAAAAPPSFDIVSVAPDGQAVIAGRAMPGDRVTVRDGDAVLGKVTADARGEWVLLPDTKLAPGRRQLSLSAVAQGGGPARHSTDVVALTVMPPKGAGGATALAVLLPGRAGEPARILQQSPAMPGEVLRLDSVEYGDGDRLVLAGHADPGAHLQVFAGTSLLGAVAADAAGRWQLVAGRPSGAGTLDLRLAELDSGGKLARTIAAPLAPPTAGGPAGPDTYVVERGNSLWRIARRLYGHGLRYTAIYRANRERIRNPDLIYPGEQLAVPKS